MATQRVQLTITDQRFFDDAQNKREAVRVWSLPWKLPYWIEKWDAQNEQAKVWVKVPKIPANGSVDLYIYYGSPTAVSESDGESVFEFFDDFEGSSLDTSKWTVRSGTSYYVQNSELHVTDRDTHIASVQAFTIPHIFEAKMKAVSINEQLGLELGDNQDHDHIRLFFLITGHDDVYIDANGDGSYEVKEDLFTDTAGDTYNPVSIAVTNSKIVLDFIRNGQRTTKTYSYGWTADTYIGLGGYVVGAASATGNELAVDWVRVRKYAEQEPTVVVGEEEASDVPGWLYRRKITITNPNSYDLEHFQVAIDFDGSNFDFTKANADGSDIRIAYASARYSLPYYIETWDTTTPQAVIWVGIDSETRFFVELDPNNTTDESDPTVMDLPEATNYTLVKFERYTGGG